MKAIAGKIEINKTKLFLLSILFFVTGDILFAQKSNGINYLNQSPPGDAAKIFAPGIISTNSFEHSSPAFSPDGTIVLWTVVSRAFRGSIFEMKYENGKWSAPYRPSFADSTADDYYPSFSFDGKKLYFSSRRQSPEGYAATIDMRIWQVERNANGWSKPVPFDTSASQGRDYAHSITKDGTIYISSPMGDATNLNIRKSGKQKGRYTNPILLPYNINSVDYEDGPYISPDESFLIFESQRPEGTDGSIDLYISFKNKKGEWSVPVNMGPKINSGSSERFAKLSPDGKFLFFGSTRNQSADSWGFDIYWIDAGVIDELRNSQAAKKIIDQPLGMGIINALYKNDTETASRLLNQWNSLYPNSLDATIIYSAALRKLNRFSEAEQLLLGHFSQWNANAGFIIETALVKLGLGKHDEASAMLTPILKEGNQRERYKYLSNALLDMRMFPASDEYFEKAMAINSNRFEYYRRARKFALIGEKDRAFEHLNKAIQMGHTAKREYENDKDLEGLKTDERWRVLMEKLK